MGCPRRSLKFMLLALERRRIGHPKAQDYADFQNEITAGICVRRFSCRRTQSLKTSQHERPRSEQRQAPVSTPEEAAGAGWLLASPQATWAVASSKVECSPKASVPAAHPQEACPGLAKLCFRNISPIPFDAKSPPVCPLDLSLRDRPTGAQQHQQQVRASRG
jgi:hypothetical protein